MLYPVIIILTISTLHESGASWCTDEQHTNCMCIQSDITCNGEPRFTEIPFNIPTSTKMLNLDNNNITSINSTVLSRLRSLKQLSLQNNQISSINSEAFSDIFLRDLRLGGNKISSIASVPSGIISLSKLDLSDNYISSIEPGAFSSFSSLYIIKLQGNNISSITADAFANFTTLSVLDLQGNKISYIEPTAFKGPDEWESLYLNDNDLTTVSANLFDSTISLEELTLHGNPLICCTMLDLIEWTKNQTKLKLFTGTCHDFNAPVDINSFNSTKCPADGEWGSWMTTPCSTTCGNGFINRKRICDSPAPSEGGQMCVGHNIEYLNVCNLGNCPVDGQWSSWSSIPCSVSCGDGIEQRIRSCDNPKPSDDGKECVGPSMESLTCNLGQCQVDGEWGSWMTTPCSTTCGNGSIYRKRICDSPAPSEGGQMCVGDNMEYLNACNLRNCPVDGQWSSWSCTSCSVSCGVGIKHRVRSCDNPKPSDDGKYCVGPSIESVICNLGKCRASCKEADKKAVIPMPRGRGRRHRQDQVRGPELWTRRAPREVQQPQPVGRNVGRRPPADLDQEAHTVVTYFNCQYFKTTTR
ncbi:slit homolog 1 protein-like [Mytilus trossulus]|uniref:slit homolog 1 protein-like n=1 Tax=Mytilus trossulus TaxID=6551 RepID=UPI003003FDF0